MILKSYLCEEDANILVLTISRSTLGNKKGAYRTKMSKIVKKKYPNAVIISSRIQGDNIRVAFIDSALKLWGEEYDHC